MSHFGIASEPMLDSANCCSLLIITVLNGHTYTLSAMIWSLSLSKNDEDSSKTLFKTKTSTLTHLLPNC